LQANKIFGARESIIETTQNANHNDELPRLQWGSTAIEIQQQKIRRSANDLVGNGSDGTAIHGCGGLHPATTAESGRSDFREENRPDDKQQETTDGIGHGV
jgi:hypothetical protein